MHIKSLVCVIFCVTVLPLRATVKGSEQFHRSQSVGIRHRCAQTKAGWCGLYLVQPRLPRKPAPRFGRLCQYNCNNVGICDLHLGSCKCPAGWTGADCRTTQKRPCTNRLGGLNETHRHLPASHIGPDGRDLNWTEPGWTASRCPGICDEDTGLCFCDTNSTHGRIPAPPGSPPGTPPIKRGRSIIDVCQLKNDSHGNHLDWGGVPYEHLYGEDGWCNAAPGVAPREMCGCHEDGWDGENCDEPVESFCPNQCTGHGECLMGYCKCKPGWFGLDCASRAEGNDEDGAIGEWTALQ
jgi:hypothetical protein